MNTLIWMKKTRQRGFSGGMKKLINKPTRNSVRMKGEKQKGFLHRDGGRG